MSMSKKINLKRAICTGGLILGVSLMAACDDKGPIEQMGEEVDEAIEDARAGGETLGNKLDDSIDELRDGAKKAKDEITGH